MNILFQGKYNSVYSFLTWWFIFPRSNSLFPASIFHHSYSCFNIQFTLPIISYPSAEISLLRHLFQFCTINNNFTAYIPSFANRHRLHLFTFISIPYSLRVSLTVVIIVCKLASLSLLKNTASLAYLRLMKFCPPIFIPLTSSWNSFIMYSVYKLNSIGEITQPCQFCHTPLFMQICDFPSIILTTGTDSSTVN